MQSHSLYLHIPFCRHRCSYCDFNTYSGLEILIPDYVQALCQEIRLVARSCNQRLPLHTIFLGGGTPSILPIKEISHIFNTILQEFDLLEGIEITLEANPERLSYEYLKSMRGLGINRISLGMQSANPEDLIFLERQHEFNQVSKAANLVRKAGFENLNLDLIFGIPNQDLASWQKSLELGIYLEPDHFSLYALTIEHGTPLGSRVAEGLLSEPDPDLSADMYEWAAEKLNQEGFEQYEISNWARRDSAGSLLTCQHNLQYWRNLPYLGMGAGAHGFSGGVRTANVLSPREYIHKMTSSTKSSTHDQLSFPLTAAIDNAITIDREQEMMETMMMGLRLTEEGISRKSFQNRFDADPQELFRNEIEELIRTGLLEWDPMTSDRLRLTPRGRLLGNQVFVHFV